MDQVNQIERNNLSELNYLTFFFYINIDLFLYFFFFFLILVPAITPQINYLATIPMIKDLKNKNKPYKSRVILFRDSKDQRFNHSIR